MKNQSFLLTLFCILFFASCASDSNYEVSGRMSSAKKMSADYAVTEAAEEVAYDESESNKERAPQTKTPSHKMPNLTRKIIKTADYHLEVAEAEPSTVKIEAIIQKHGGYISDMNWTKSNPWIQNSLKIRVPNENFDALMLAIGQEGVDTRLKKVKSRDVTEESLDNTSRLATKKQVKERYEQILRSKAQSVEEVLMAEEKIRVLQEEIEAKEGRLRYLSDQVSWSTINLVLFQKMPVIPNDYIAKNTFFAKAKRGFGNGWAMITDTLLLFINIWPLALVLGAVLVWKRHWLSIRIRRRGRENTV